MLPASDLVEIVGNLAALQLAPNTTAAVLGTAINARNELAGEARKAARKETRRRSHEKSKAAQPERRQRAQQFLRDALAHGPQQISDLEEAAVKAHIDVQTLEQARGDLGVVVSRGNAG